MKKFIPLAAILIFCFMGVPLEAKTISTDHIHIHTYGGGALLEKVFNAISMLMYGKGSGFGGILKFCAIIGGFGALILAMAKGSWEALLTNWFFPSILIFCVIIAPRDTVYIKDHLVEKAGSTTEQVVYKVDNVPLFLKLFCGTVSTLTHELTKSLEEVTHGVDDSTYNWTGHIYAGDTLFQAGKVQINDPFLEQNIHNLVYDCVFNDISQRVPRYTKKDLYNAKDILGFISPRTNAMLSTRMLDSSGEYTPMKCHKAAEKVKADFDALTVGGTLANFNQMNSATEDDLKSKIFGEISSEAHLLKGLKNDAMKQHSKMMKQSLMIDSTQKTLAPKAYATLKAEQLHKQQQGILGAMGAKSIVAMKNFFEAVAYTAFPIILLLALCIMGFRTIATWLQFLLWINLWPPFFVIVNFLLNTTWDLRVAKVFGAGNVGLTIFSSHGLADLYSSMESIAAGALFSVPFLAYAIVRGGVGSMMQLSSTLNAPAQSAASQAASEKVSGNYSVGNIQWQNENISSTSMFQQNENPMLNQGSRTVGSGLNTMKMASDGSFAMSREQSSIGADVSISEAYGHGIQTQYTEAQQHLQSKTETYNESWQQVGSSGENFMHALGNDHTFSHLKSRSEQDAAIDLYNKTEQQIEDYARNYNLSESTTIEYAAKAGAGISLKVVDIGGSASTSGGNKHDEAEAVAHRDNEFKALNENIQKLKQYQLQDSDSQNLSQTQRASNDYGNQVSHAQNATEQLSIAKNNHETWQNIHDTFDRSSSDQKQSLNNEFVQEMMEKYDDPTVISEMLQKPEELQKNLGDFSMKIAQKMVESKFENVQEKVKDIKETTKEVPTEMTRMQTESSNVRSSAKTKIDKSPNIGAKYEGIKRQYKYKKNNEKIENDIQAQNHIDQKKVEMAETKISKEHKEKVKAITQEHAAKTLAKDTGKSIGKFMEGQKRKAYARSERLQAELKRRKEE